MTVLDVTLVNVALPVMVTEFGISNSLSIWVVAVYQLIITMLLLPLSSAGDMFSYRRNFLIGVVIFTIASALCAMSVSFTMLLAARAVQGVGAACVMSVNIALTRLIYPRKIIARGMALNAMTIACATAAGPSIAGAILSITSWHWLFIINIPFGIAAFFIGKKLLPHNPPTDNVRKFDYFGAIENIMTFGLIFYALGNFSRKGEVLPNIIILSLGLFIGFFYIRRQCRLEHPMFPIDLFKIKLYSMSIATYICSFIAQSIIMISLPFLFLKHYGFSEALTGLLMTPLPVATMIMAPFVARFIEKHNPGITASVGMSIYALGIFLLLVLSPDKASITNISCIMALCGVGFGLFQTPNNVVMVMATPISRTGSAGGMQSSSRLVGQTTGSTIVTLIFAIVSPLYALDISLSIAIILALTAAVISISRCSFLKNC